MTTIILIGIAVFIFGVLAGMLSLSLVAHTRSLEYEQTIFDQERELEEKDNTIAGLQYQLQLADHTNDEWDTAFSKQKRELEETKQRLEQFEADNKILMNENFRLAGQLHYVVNH